MKRKLFLTVIIVALTVLFFGAVSAFAETYGPLTYTIYNEEVYIVNCEINPEDTKIFIPESIEGCPVVEIETRAFESCNITELSIPNSVKTISSNSFYDCTQLAKVDLGNGISTIGDYAFYRCERLTEISLPDSVTTIGNSAFMNCSDLVKVSLGKNLITIGDAAFANCSINSIIIPDNVTQIGESAFNSCKALTTITLGSKIDTIKSDAFKGCSQLTDISIPDSVTTVGYWAFANCSNLSHCNIGSGVREISNSIFENCTSLESISVDKNNPYYASDEHGVLFSKDKALLVCFPAKYPHDIYTVPEGVTDIDTYSFSNCSNLKTIVIPSSTTYIKPNSFHLCLSLEKLIVNPDNTRFSSDEYGVLFNKDKTELIRFPEFNSQTKYNIPDSVTTISSCAFQNCWVIKTVVIPDNVKRINEETFYNCKQLSNVHFGKNVTHIGISAFENCESLTTLSMPHILSINQNAFKKCTSLKSILISYKLDSVTSGAFNYCSALTDVYFYGTKDQFRQISVGSSNTAFLNATIHYLPFTETVVSDNGKNFAINSVNINLGENVILALYDNGKFVELQTAVYEGNEITFTTDLPYTDAKVMVWNGTDNIVPVTIAEQVK